MSRWCGPSLCLRHLAVTAAGKSTERAWLQAQCGKLATGDGKWQAVRLIHFILGYTGEAEVELAPIYALRCAHVLLACSEARLFPASRQLT